ncbi:hypothetical protein B0H19DRAFT_1073823 [Mycena capillaripes]|nr:hypothetical protein B0H19DRAFT_1073823 [Mycena capillaripes]
MSAKVINLHGNDFLHTTDLGLLIFAPGISITSMNNPNEDIPGDMQMFAQVAIKNKIFLQTVSLVAESSEQPVTWKLQVDCNLPCSLSTFVIAIMGRKEAGGTRLLGFLRITMDEILRLTKFNIYFFQRQLRKINPDGPSLELSAEFQEPTAQPVRSEIDVLDAQIISLKKYGIDQDMEKINFTVVEKTQSSTNSLQVQVMHERILMLSDTNKRRDHRLNMLGKLCLKSFRLYGTVEDLHQSISIHADAVRDAGGVANFCVDFGVSLHQCYEQLGNLSDLTQAVLIIESALELTPHGELDMPSLVNNLGNSLLSRFERFGNLDDLTKAKSILESAVKLTPESHAHRVAQLYSL